MGLKHGKECRLVSIGKSLYNERICLFVDLYSLCYFHFYHCDAEMYMDIVAAIFVITPIFFPNNLLDYVFACLLGQFFLCIFSHIIFSTKTQLLSFHVISISILVSISRWFLRHNFFFFHINKFYKIGDYLRIILCTISYGKDTQDKAPS